jgi:hypothetical protein
MSGDRHGNTAERHRQRGGADQAERLVQHRGGGDHADHRHQPERRG